MNIYTIRDDTGGFFLPPFTALNDGIAKRMFISSLGDSCPHRKDFVLFNIGVFDDDNGTITPCHPINVLAGFSIPIDLDPRFQPQSKEIAA
jgi:hypothetical protein